MVLAHSFGLGIDYFGKVGIGDSLGIADSIVLGSFLDSQPENHISKDNASRRVHYENKHDTSPMVDSLDSCFLGLGSIGIGDSNGMVDSIVEFSLLPCLHS